MDNFFFKHILDAEKDQSAGSRRASRPYQVGYPIRFAQTWLAPTCTGVANDPGCSLIPGLQSSSPSNILAGSRVLSAVGDILRMMA